MATNPKFYKTAKPYIKESRAYLTPGDNLRIGAYDLYYDMYWSDPDALAILRRGETNPIIMPSGRVLCNTINRYVATGFTAVPDPTLGTPEQQTAMDLWFKSLFKRERFQSRFAANKLATIQKGDSCWYISADPDKPEGTRISVRPLDPGKYFPIDDPEDSTRIVGCQIIEEIAVQGAEGLVPSLRIQTWFKPGHPEGVSDEFISYMAETWKMEGYPADKRKAIGAGAVQLPVEEITGITHLPIYHIPNTEEEGTMWGSSEMRGLEPVIAGIDQSISDEDLTLVLQGLGMYYTDGGGPVDAANNDSEWDLGPGKVVEIGDGKTFGRVTGVTTVTPMQEHIKYLEDRMSRVNGAGDVAMGIVDSGVAESGIALALRMGPILEAASNKDSWLMDKTDQMFHDLREWARVYEGQNFDDLEMLSMIGDKLPENKQNIFDNYLAMYNSTPPLISGATFRAKAAEMGYKIPDKELETILDEQMQIQQAEDEYAARMAEENGTLDEEGIVDEQVVTDE